MIQILIFLRKATILLILLIVIQSYLQAQNPAAPDTSFGIGSFNSWVWDIKTQSDSKILLGGNFTFYKNIPVNRLARLNSDGSLDNTFNIGSGCDNTVRTIAIQNDGKILVGGDFYTFNGVSKAFFLRLNSDGSIDNTFNIGSGPNGSILTIKIQTDGKILLAGMITSFNSVQKNDIVRLNPDGSIDNTFDIGSGLDDGPTYIGSINSIGIQSDGKIVAGGSFLSFNGIPKRNILRLNINGSLDSSFTYSSLSNFKIRSVAIQNDGKILAGGYLLNIVRLNSDGSVDNTFNPGTGANDEIFSIVSQNDGQIIAGGNFTSFNGIAKNKIVRINPDGSLDNTLNIGTGANGCIYSIALQSDGKILAGGEFTCFAKYPQNHFVRLNTDGAVDITCKLELGTDSYIQSLAIQSDEKILAGGNFTTFNGNASNYVVRINKDGSVDNTFAIGSGADNTVNSIVIQNDGKILLGGKFKSFNGINKNNIVRLNSDGTIDNTFNIGTGSDNYIGTIVIQSDGKILAAGSFTNFNGVPKNDIVRLNTDGTVDNTFNTSSRFMQSLYATTIQKDGKILLGGYDGSRSNYLVRLNSNGDIDSTFKPILRTGSSLTIYSILIQSDGKILTGGNVPYSNKTSKRISRLNPDGSMDNTFRSDPISYSTNGWVLSMKLQNDGKVLVGGNFSSYNSTPKSGLVRLNSDGSVDNTFDNGTDPGISINSIVIQSNGKIFLGGSFSLHQGLSYNNIVKLNGDPAYYNTIEGNIFTDSNKDCNFQPSENPQSSVIVKALPGPFYGGADAFGHYKLRVDSGSVTYTVTQNYNSIMSKLLVNQCTPSHVVTLNGDSKSTCCFNFADSVGQCYLLDVNIQRLRTRRCMTSYTYLNYTNYGKVSAYDTQVTVEFPSDFIPISSFPMWTGKSGSVLTFDIGTLAPDAIGRITIMDSVACIAGITGLTECIKAFITPVSECVLINPAWDKSSMKVIGTCNGSLAHFNITNEGLGDMVDSLQFRLYVNDTLIYRGSYRLNSGDSIILNYPSAGQTMRLEADQSILHPGKSRPRAVLENCGSIISSPATKGLVSSSPLDELDEEIAITCNIISDSFDPNEKQALPSGIGTSHKIAPGEEIEYIIHFQNTGSDTAYTVLVVDTLDTELDIASFIKGVSSNSYSMNISGKVKPVLTFKFEGINLPDSTTNSIASNGMISFRISVPSNTTIGTVIKNKANIIFDYNTPVVTNETMHTVDTATIINLSKGNAIITGIGGTKIIQQAKIYPNPTTGMITVEIPEGGYNNELRISSMLGTLKKSIILSEKNHQVTLEGISQGMYLYEVWRDGVRISIGKLQIWF